MSRNLHHDLVQFIQRSFTPDQLRWLVRHYFDEITDSLPGETASYITLAGDLVDQVIRRGMLVSDAHGLGLLEVLARADPTNEPEIRRIARDAKLHLPTELPRIRVGSAASRRATYRVFISYAHKDRVIAQMFEALLGTTGLQVFLDTKTLEAGDVWPDRLKTEILASDRVYLLWSAQAKASEWVEKEYRMALQIVRDEDVRGFLVVVNLDGTPLPEDLQRIQAIDIQRLLGPSTTAGAELSDEVVLDWLKHRLER